jgi:hypothetical protein
MESILKDGEYSMTGYLQTTTHWVFVILRIAAHQNSSPAKYTMGHTSPFLLDMTVK